MRRLGRARSGGQALALALAAVGLLAGCGIQPTGAVAYGEAPRGVAEGPTLYFYRGAQLVPVVRRIGKLGEPTVALQELFRGVLPTEERGLYSRLPKGSYGTLTARASGKNTVEVQVRNGGWVQAFDEAGLRQIACTMMARNMAEPGVWSPGTVMVNGVAVTSETANCGSRDQVTTPA